MRIVINGFGRIGRTILRQILTQPGHDDIEVALINDIAPLETCAYLFKYDSTFGPLPCDVAAEKAGLRVGNKFIPFSSSPFLARADFANVDVVMECTGQINSCEDAERGLNAGSGTVLISGPSEFANTTIVLGANDETLGEARIVSNSSCTTNAIAPLLRAIDLGFGIERATTTSATSELLKVLPDVGKLTSVAAVRVPSISVSAIDATLQLSTPVGPSTNAFLESIAKRGGVIGATQDDCVSRDMRARPESLVIALPETQTVGTKQLRVFGWYDNEWGFSARMIDMARKLAARTK